MSLYWFAKFEPFLLEQWLAKSIPMVIAMIAAFELGSERELQECAEDAFAVFC